MKLLILLILIMIIYYIYNEDTSIEYFKNDTLNNKDKINKYLKELQDLIINGKLQNTTINSDLLIKGSSDINNINNNIDINGNLTINKDTSGNIIYLDKLIIDNKHIFYTKKDALIIGKIDKEKNIYPNIILNPGSNEGLWIINNFNSKDINYYWYNNGKSGRASRKKEDLNDDILKNSNIRPFKYIDNL